MPPLSGKIRNNKNNMDTCVKCGMPVDDDSKCSCDPSLCAHCCACPADCACGCSNTISDLPDEEDEDEETAEEEDELDEEEDEELE